MGPHDKGRIAEEPGEGKLSSPVLEQRWAGRLTHRLSQIERRNLLLKKRLESNTERRYSSPTFDAGTSLALKVGEKSDFWCKAGKAQE